MHLSELLKVLYYSTVIFIVKKLWCFTTHIQEYSRVYLLL